MKSNCSTGEHTKKRGRPLRQAQGKARKENTLIDCGFSNCTYARNQIGHGHIDTKVEDFVTFPITKLPDGTVVLLIPADEWDNRESGLNGHYFFTKVKKEKK